METNSRIQTRITKGEIEVAEIRVSDFQKAGTKTAVLKQTVETLSLYPTKTVTSDMQDNIFSTEDFGFENQEFKSTRTNVAFIPVPENATVETVKKQLSKFPNATLYRVISNEPILTSNQKYAIEAGLKTMDDFANSQVVRYPEGDPKAGELILDKNGKVQYKAVFFSTQNKEDIDMRTDDEKMYLSEEIEHEYSNAILVS